MKPSLLACGLLAATISLTGCASLTVKPVIDARGKPTNVHGLRYYLPKPVLLLSPQSDGTVTLDVIYLPNTKAYYAISTDSYLSSYTFQLSLDQNGLLNSLEYKVDTSAVGQQLATTGGAVAAQAYNLQAARAVAAQSAVSTAQTAVDQAQAAFDAARAQLGSDQAAAAGSNPPATIAATIVTDQGAYATAQAKLTDAQRVLTRTQGQSQVVSSVSATAPAPITTTGPTMGTAFGSPTWTATTPYSLPENVGPVLYGINETVVDGAPVLTLRAVTYSVDGAPQGDDHKPIISAQPPMVRYVAAQGQPVLPNNLSFPIANEQAMLLFDRDIAGVSTSSVGQVADKAGAPDKNVSGVTVCMMDKNPRILLVTTKTLTAGKTYDLTVLFSYDPNSKATSIPLTPPTKGHPLPCSTAPAGTGQQGLAKVTFNVF